LVRPIQEAETDVPSSLAQKRIKKANPQGANKQLICKVEIQPSHSERSKSLSVTNHPYGRFSYEVHRNAVNEFETVDITSLNGAIKLKTSRRDERLHP
ncbi:hypothetical protein OAE63_01685, partial [bacterium]|nr:hypothetical protein [bacterium]